MYKTCTNQYCSYRHRFIRELIEWKPDVIHSQCEFFSYQFASYISKKTGAPIVHTYHALYEQYVTYVLPSQRLGEYFIGKLSRMRLKHAEVIVAPTQKVENVLRNYGIQNPKEPERIAGTPFYGADA